MDRQSGLRQESEDPDGKMSCQKYVNRMSEKHSLIVAGLFEEALEALAKHQHKLDFMFENIVPMSKAVEYYDLFNNMKVQKVVFEADKVS